MNILRKIPRGGCITPLQDFLYKLKRISPLIFKLCTLDTKQARESAAEMLIEAIGIQYQVLANKRGSTAQKQKASRIMGYLIQVLNPTLDGLTTDLILDKWKKVEQLAEAEYGKPREGSGEVDKPTPTS
jgi:hypothetical protein